jgi:hypothetical protein
MKRLSLLAACVAALMAVPCLAAESGPENPKIQIAILLDTSSSMDGLINQTREQLWKIVNTFTNAKREGKKATLELALYEYGNDGLSPKENWIRQVVPLTTNLDQVSEALFRLRTNGGSEYCGAVIEKATHDLGWSDRKGDLKLIYIAGNEPFTQGPIDFHGAVKGAISKGVVVNTIHAGDERTGISGSWKEAALLADGNYLFIDQNRQVARVDAPQDQELAKLNDQLNKTYIGYGPQGQAAAARQEAQDKNALGMSMSSGSARIATKASAAYDNAEWDLVDAKKKGKLDAIAPAALPAPMQAMKPEERKAFVEQKEKERAELTKKIQAVSAERDAFVAKELAKKAKDGTKTLDDALLESAKTQGAKAAYSF